MSADDQLAELRAASRYLQLPASNRARLDAVGPRLIEAAGATPAPDTTLARGLNFLEGIARRGSYLALLQQYPMALRRVADMICASNWAAEYLNRTIYADSTAMGTDTAGIVINDAIKSAILLHVGLLYENRENTVLNGQEMHMGAKWLLNPYRLLMGV